jgi:hypothetical protein
VCEREAIGAHKKISHDIFLAVYGENSPARSYRTAAAFNEELTYADVCSYHLTYADVCSYQSQEADLDFQDSAAREI